MSHIPIEPAEEEAVGNPTQTMEGDILTRYHQARTKGSNKLPHIIHRVLWGKKPLDIADKKIKFMIYLTIGVGGRKMHTRKYPHTNVEIIATQQLSEELLLTLVRPMNLTLIAFY